MTLYKYTRSVLFCVMALYASFASAEVKDVSAGGFTIQHVVTIKASPLEAYQALTDEVRQWWDGAHTYTGSPENLYMEPDVGGCFCEILPSGGGVEYMHIIYADPGKALRMTGGLGPLQELAVQGSMTWLFKKSGNSTRLELTYRVGGYLAEGMQTWAEPVDRVLKEQVARLKKFTEENARPQ